MTNNLNISTLENWLWEAACKISGEIDAPKYKEYILPLIFMKRLSDVYEDEINGLKEEYGDYKVAEAIAREDHSVLRFYLPEETRWGSIAKLTANIGDYLTYTVRMITKHNPQTSGRN